MKENHLPGAALVLVHKGRVTLKRGYGFANVEAQTPVDPDKTLFRIGSISKALTLLAVSRLVDDGRLNYTDDVAQYFPGIPNPGGFPAVTISDLLTHTTGFDQVGLNRHVWQLALTLDERKALRPGLEEFLRDNNLRRVSPAGQFFRYDTYGSTLAGVVLAKVTGLPYPEAMTKELFAPLGMSRTFVEVDEDHFADLAHGYGYVDDGYVPQPYEVYVTLPASSIDATPADMGRLLEALTGNGSSREGRLFSSEMAAAVRTPQFRPHPEFLGKSHGLRESWAGQDLFDNPVRTMGHGGDMLGFNAELILIPEYELGIFVIANRNGEAGGGPARVGEPVMAAAIQSLHSGPAPQPIPLPQRVTDGDLSAYVGTYAYGVYCHSCSDEEFSRGGWRTSASREVTASNGALWIGEDEFLPQGEGVFVQADGRRRVFFGSDDTGKTTFFLYSSSVDTFERVE